MREHNPIPDSYSAGENITSNVQPPKEIPSVKETFLIMVLTVGFIMFISTLFFIISLFYEIQIEYLLIEAVFVVPALIYGKAAGYKLIKMFRLNPISTKILLLSTVTGLSLVTVINFIENWVSQLPMPEWYSELANEMESQMMDTLIFSNFYDFAILSISIIFAAAICEEMLFRGLMQTSLEQRMPKWLAICLIAFLFTLLHPLSLIPIFPFAAALGFICWMTDSIYPSIIIHGMNNGISLYSLNLSTNLQISPEEGIPIPFYFFIFGLAVFTYCIVCLYQLTRKKEADGRLL